MEINFRDIFRNIKLQTFIGAAIILLIYKLLLPSNSSFVFRFVGDILVLITAATLVIYFIEQLNSKTINPLSLVMNVGILNVILFCLISFSGSIFELFFENVTEKAQNPGFVLSIAGFIYAFLIFGSIAYIFLAFKELYFLKAKEKCKYIFQHDDCIYNSCISFLFIKRISGTFFYKKYISYCSNSSDYNKFPEDFLDCVSC